jgi:hypothetical protein
MIAIPKTASAVDAWNIIMVLPPYNLDCAIKYCTEQLALRPKVISRGRMARGQVLAMFQVFAPYSDFGDPCVFLDEMRPFGANAEFIGEAH